MAPISRYLWTYMKPVCVMFISGIVVNPSIAAIIDQCQPAKDTDPYFKFQVHVKDFGNRNPVLIVSVSVYVYAYVYVHIDIISMSTNITILNYLRC